VTDDLFVTCAAAFLPHAIRFTEPTANGRSGALL